MGPRTWEDHLSINSCNSVTKAGSTIYASYGNGIIYFNESEVSPRALNKINGLNDVGVRVLRANPHNNKVLVIYDNCNIDVIDAQGNISNYPDIKFKSFSGRKIVNDVTFSKNLAYLACGFGIVVFDTEKLEILDTYVIGLNGSYLEVKQVALTDSLIMAATTAGMLEANYKRDLLVNFKNWKWDTVNIPKGPYVGVLNGAGQSICCYSPFSENNAIKGKDTFYIRTGNGPWQKYAPLGGMGQTIMRLGPVQGDIFGVTDLSGYVARRINTGDLVMHINSFNGQVDYGTIRDAYFSIDHTANRSYWIADVRFGLYQAYSYWPFYPQTRVTRNGTNSKLVSNIDILNGRVAVAPAYVSNTGTGTYSREGLNILEDGEWSYLPLQGQNGEEIIDVTSVLLDRFDKSTVWAGTWNYGILEYKDKKLVAAYTPSNTNMPEIGPRDPHVIGLAQDKDGNVWFANSEQKRFLGVIRKVDRQYIGYEFDAGRFVRKVFIDKSGYIWVLHEREGGITVFKHNNFSNPVYKVLSKDAGNGKLESNAVYCIAEDKDGKIWVGTASGISVFYNPSQVFSNSNFDAQPIKIVQGGNVELLLGNQIVTAIAIDGANNKWVGTANGGVFCFSPDGIRQIHHFTAANSALYSDAVIDINYDENTGDVFIGTEQGLQSYRSITVKGEEFYENVYAYPNPVKPGYSGTVLVRGLMDNSVVKITDVAGNLVWETKSFGGQIEWPVKTLSGNRVSSGVYIVYAATPTGESKAMTKVLVVN